MIIPITVSSIRLCLCTKYHNLLVYVLKIDQTFKTKKYLVCNKIKQRTAANPNTLKKH